jgi:DNA-binding response OmpR family regulator
MLQSVILKRPKVLHVCSRETIRELRDQILRLQGFDVDSTLHVEEAVSIFRRGSYDLVLIDVEGDGRIPQAEKLCADLRTEHPGQKVAFVCNHRVAIESDCPDELIRAEFNPQALVSGVRELMA